MKSALVSVLVVFLGGCAAAPSYVDEPEVASPLSTTKSVGHHAVAPGLTGNTALLFLKQKRAGMADRINTEKANNILATTITDLDSYRTQSNVISGTTLAVGGILAIAADYAVAGGVVTALLGGYSLYNENQRNDQTKVELITACRNVVKSGADVIDRYTDRWEIVFLQYNTSILPDKEVERFNEDTSKTNDRIRDLVGTCV